MKIQNLLLPKVGICSEEKMYYRREKNRDREVLYNAQAGELSFQKFGWCGFGTYFNGLSIEKWKKYTTIGDVRLCLRLKGSFEVTLVNYELKNAGQVRLEELPFLHGDDKNRDKVSDSARFQTRIVEQFQVCEAKMSLMVFPYRLYEYKGMLAFSLRAMADGAVYSGGWYEADVDESKLNKVDIALDICTFKREPYIARNLDILRRDILEKPQSELYGHLQVYIQDNAQTLPIGRLQSDTVHIVPNKNVGGAGGFTRGLMEIMAHHAEYPATHALLMDDDVIIESESLLRTYMMLRCRKAEYDDLFIGGAMLRSDDQSRQVESGASWNAGKLVSNKAGLDLNSLYDCLRNEVEEYTEYTAWWYCCIPMRKVTDTNLPLPIFIRGDDLEYGLRNMKHLALLNGICVWHETFENKYSSYLHYYILRNLLYDNAMHFPEYSLPAFLIRLYKQAAREFVCYRYKNIDLLFRGVNDFYKGVDFLKNTDGAQLHRKIMAAGYQAVPVEELKEAAFRMPVYEQSLILEHEAFLHKLLRYVTWNGFFLPARHVQGRNVQVVSMAQCRPINFYRQKIILNYDANSGRGFVTRKSWGQAFKAVAGLLALTVRSVWQFPLAMRSFRQRSGELTSEESWRKYLMEE